jgi:hypothetical protein
MSGEDIVSHSNMIPLPNDGANIASRRMRELGREGERGREEREERESVCVWERGKKE